MVDDAADGSTDADGDDDDEDITGEQDTDDFLAVLDQGTNSTPTSTREADPDAEPDRVVDAVVEPEADAGRRTRRSSRKPTPVVESDDDRKPMQSSRTRRRSGSRCESSNPTSTAEADAVVEPTSMPTSIDVESDDEPG